MFKRLSQLLLVMLLVMSTSMSSFAYDSNQVKLTYLPTTYSSTDQTEDEGFSFMRSLNLVPIRVTANSDGTGCNVYVGNAGIDGLDRVTVTVKATGYGTPKTLKHYVPAVFGKNFKFDFPMIKADTSYDVTITIFDAGQYVYKEGSASIVFTESGLSGLWHKGSSYSSRAASLENHFDRHGDEVNSKNMVNYLNQAMSYRAQILNDISNGDLSKYRVTTGTGSIPSKKYKHLIDRRFIILNNSTDEAFTFGK